MIDEIWENYRKLENHSSIRLYNNAYNDRRIQTMHDKLDNPLVQYVTKHPGVAVCDLDLLLPQLTWEDYVIPRVRGWVVERTICRDGYMTSALYPEGTCPPKQYNVQCMDILLDLLERPGAICVLDTETTGLKETDEVLQLSMIDGMHRTLVNEYFRPIARRSWAEAQRINHISPEMVADKHPLQDYAETISTILEDYEAIVGYNTYFDLGFLEAAGVVIPDVPIIDVMEDYAPIAGEWSDYYNAFRWQKLTSCAAHYGYVVDNDAAHNALEDCEMTLHCCRGVAFDQFDHGRHYRGDVQ